MHPAGRGLDARLTNLLREKNIVTKSKEVKPGLNLEESADEDYGSKRAVLLMMFRIDSKRV
jgi:hypothetical protein